MEDLLMRLQSDRPTGSQPTGKWLQALLRLSFGVCYYLWRTR